MKRMVYLAAIVLLAAAAYTSGFLFRKRSKPTAEARADSLVVQYRAATFLTNGRLAEAEAAYDELIQIDPHLAEPYVGLAACRMQKSDFAGAVELYRKALARDETSVEALIGLGSAYGLQSDYTNAAASFEKALSVNERQAAAIGGLLKPTSIWGRRSELRRTLSGSNSLILAHRGAVTWRTF